MDDDDIVCLSPEPRQVFEGAKETHRPSAGRGRGRGDGFRYWRRDEEQNNFNRPRRNFNNRRSPSPGGQRSSSYGRYNHQGNHHEGNHHEGRNDQDLYSKRPRTSPGNDCGAYYGEDVETRPGHTSYYNRPRIQNNHLHSRPSVDSRPYGTSFQRPGTVFPGTTSSENDALPTPTIENALMVRNPLFKPHSSQTKPSGYLEPITKIRRRRKSPSMLEPLYNTSSSVLHPPQSSVLSASSNNVPSDTSDLPVEETPTIRPPSSPEVIELEGSDDEIQMILEKSVSSSDRGPAVNKTAPSEMPKTSTDNQTSQSVKEIRDQHVQTGLQKKSKEVEKSRQVVSKVSTGVQTDETTISSSSSSGSSSDDDDDGSSSSDSTSESEEEGELGKDKVVDVEQYDQRANGSGDDVQHSQSRSVEEVEEDDVVILEERLLMADAVQTPLVRDRHAVKVENCDLHNDDTNAIPAVVEKEVVSEVVPKCVQVETRDMQDAVGDVTEMEIEQPETVVGIVIEKSKAADDEMNQTENSESKADEMNLTENSESKADGMNQTENSESNADEMEQTEEPEANADGMNQTENSESKADEMEQTEEPEANAGGSKQAEMSKIIESSMENGGTQETESVDLETEKADRTESVSMVTGKLPQAESSTMETDKVTNPETMSMETVKIETSNAATIEEENPAIPSDPNSSQTYVFKRESDILVETNSLSPSSSAVSDEAAPSTKEVRLSSSASVKALKNLVTGDMCDPTLARREVINLKGQVVEGPKGFNFEFDPSVRELVTNPMLASQILRLQQSLPGLIDGAVVEIKVNRIKQRRRPTSSKPSSRCSSTTEASGKDCKQSVETESPLVDTTPTQKAYACVQRPCQGPSSSESDSMNTPSTIGVTDKETDENVGSEMSEVTHEKQDSTALSEVKNVAQADELSSTLVHEPTLKKTDDALGITHDRCNGTKSSLSTNNLTNKKLPPLQNFSAGLSPVNFEPSATQGFAGSYQKIREALLKKKITRP